MGLWNHFTLHHFFKNKELNYFYYTIAIMAFADSLIGIFVPIHLFQMGFAIHKIVFFYFLVSLFFVLLSYPGSMVVSRVGVRRAILFSTPFLILYYLGLHYLSGQQWMFYVLPLLLALRMVLYNFGYHLNYISHSNKKKRGRELSFISGISLLMHIVAPFVGGLISFYTSFSLLYLVGSVLLVVGVFPLFLGKEKHIPLRFTLRDLWGGILKRDRGSFVSFSGYAVESVIGRSIWPIFLILLFGTVAKTGLLVTLSMVLSLAVFYFAGKLTDRYDRNTLLRFGTLFYFFAWVGRIFVDSSLSMILVDSYKNVTQKVLQIPWDAKSFDLAAKRNVFQFLVGREVIYNFSRVLVMPLLILIFYLNESPFLISFVIAALFSLGYMFLDKK